MGDWLGRTAVYRGEDTVLFDNGAGAQSSHVLAVAADIVLDVLPSPPMSNQ